jgi:hypothetical protein
LDDTATPKSTTLRRPSLRIIKFCGLTSRCTTCSERPLSSRAWCAKSSAAAASRMMAAATRSGTRFCWRAQPRNNAERSTPPMYSMAMKCTPSCTPTSYTATMLGWFKSAATRASSRN